MFVVVVCTDGSLSGINVVSGWAGNTVQRWTFRAARRFVVERRSLKDADGQVLAMQATLLCLSLGGDAFKRTLKGVEGTGPEQVQVQLQLQGTRTTCTNDCCWLCVTKWKMEIKVQQSVPQSALILEMQPFYC